MISSSGGSGGLFLSSSLASSYTRKRAIVPVASTPALFLVLALPSSFLVPVTFTVGLLVS